MNTSPPKEEEDAPTCHFLTTIPLEIRLEIYKYLLVLDLQPPQNRSLASPKPPTKEYLSSEPTSPDITKGPSTSTTSTTTTNNPPNDDNNDSPSSTTSPPKRNHPPSPPLLHPSILATCRQIYCESLPILYKSNTFLAHETNLTISPSLFLPPPPISSSSYTYKSPSPYLLSRSATPISVSLSPSIHSPRPNPNIYLIRRWRMRVRLDCGFPPWQSDQVTRAFSGAEELTLCVYRAMFIGGVGVDVLRRFEGVRGVRRVKILGCLKGFEGYVRWLEGVMMREAGQENDNEEPWALREDGREKEGNGSGSGEMNGHGNGNEGKEVFMVGGYRCANELERKRLTGWVC